jgi:hypothetical protein
MAEPLDYRNVLEKLRDKTQAGRVGWRVVPGYVAGDTFECDLEQYKFTVWRDSDGFIARMEVLNVPSSIFTVRAEEQIIYRSDESRQMYELLSDLYELARRKALSVPEKLADVAELLDRI